MTSQRKARTVRDLPVREIGIALVALGAIGIASVIVAFIVVGGLVARLQAVSDAAAGPLESTARTLADASDAFDRFATSLEQARQSSEDAAALVAGTGETLSTLADTMSIQIFGTQPLLPAAEGFRNASDQLAGLSGDLESMSDALGANIEDVERASLNLRLVRNDMDSLIAAFETDDGSDGGIGIASLGIYVLLAWLGLMALGCLAMGVLILRR